MRVWICVAAGVLALPGCRRENPAWLRATDVAATDALTDVSAGETDGTSAGSISGSDSEGAGTTGLDPCAFTFPYDTNLVSRFAALSASCSVSGTYYIRYDGANTIELFNDDTCSMGGFLGASSDFSSWLLGSLPEATCLHLQHGATSTGGCQTTYAVVYDPSEPALDGAPLLIFSRDLDVPNPFINHPGGFSVGIAPDGELICSCSVSPMSGRFAPPCCDDTILRHQVEFSIEGSSFTLAPGEEASVDFSGTKYKMRLFAAEQSAPQDLAPDVDCTDQEQLQPYYRYENVVWLMDWVLN